MAQIPDYRALKPRLITGSVPGVRVGEGPSPIGGIPEALGEWSERLIKREVADAQTSFYLKKAEIDNEFDEFQGSYAEMVPEYDRRIGEVMNESSSMVSASSAREAFLNDARLKTAQSRERIRDMAWDREIDENLAQTMEERERLIEAALKSGDVSGAVAAFHSRLSANAESRYIGETDLVKHLNAFKEELATAWIGSRSPGEQIRLLQADTNLPASKRFSMLNAARKAASAAGDRARKEAALDFGSAVGREAENLADSIQRIDEAFPDDFVAREYALKAAKYEVALREQADAQSVAELLDEVRVGKTDGKYVRPSDIANYAALPNDVRLMVDAEFAPGKRVGDAGKTIEIIEAIDAGDLKKARDLRSKYADVINEDQAKLVDNKILQTGELLTTPKYGETQFLASYEKEIKDPLQLRRFRTLYNRQVDSWRSIYGKEPPLDEMKKMMSIAKIEAIEMEFDMPGWWDKTLPQLPYGRQAAKIIMDLGMDIEKDERARQLVIEASARIDELDGDVEAVRRSIIGE